MFLFEFDVKTILFFLAVDNLAAALVFFVYFWAKGFVPEAGRFMAGAFCLAVAWSLLCFWELNPNFFSVYLGNTLLLVGFSLVCLALDLSLDSQPAKDRNYAIVASSGFLIFLPIAIFSEQIKLILSSYINIIPYLMLFYSLLKNRNTKNLPTRAAGNNGINRSIYLLITGLAAFSAFLLFLRGSFALVMGKSFTLLNPSFVNTMVYIPLFLFTPTATIALLLLLKEKSDIRLAESEAKYRTLVESASEGISIIQDSRFVFVNSSLAKLLGISAYALLGLNFSDFVYEEDRKFLLDRLENATSSQDTAHFFDLRLIDSSGQAHWMSVHFTLVDWEGSPASLGLFTDINDRKKNEAVVNSLLAEKEALLREVNHRVKNNLSIIMNLLSLEAMSASDKKPEMVINDAKNRLQSMMQLYALLNEGKEYIDVSAKNFFIRLVTEILAVYPESKEVKMVFDIEDFNLDGDRLARLGLIINEFISNSMKHAFANTARPEIVLKADCNNKTLNLSLKDNGQGFESGMVSDGLGQRLVIMLAKQLNAKISVDGTNGASYVLKMPINK